MSRSEAISTALPERIAERVRKLCDRPVPAGGQHVLYWMHHAVRAHENPALDAAILAASVLELPLLVYQGLGPGHRFDNDRHHTFILEGAREVRAELAARGLSYAFHLGDAPGKASPLAQLASEAALVVTEDFPAPPFPRWSARLGERSPAPLWLVDTACLVPMRLLSRRFDRAFRFRKAIEDQLGARLARPWSELDLPVLAFDAERLPFADLNLAEANLGELVARCSIDHSVGPVAHSPGGSTAGYQRWQAFRDAGLDAYAERRNDAATDGVSRMSPYLHHGHVSPLRIAREAHEQGGPGAEKFLDELIVWRELAHNLCFHRPHELESLAVLPQWARTTLQAHAEDPREPRSSETLARGRTGDRLWDLCQASLLRHGELHNNLRMTWGKAMAGWTPSPERALALLIELNHRFALDGSDPNSYGGLLWCLGMFDRPFEPERPVLGTVRSRPSASHAARVDLDRVAARVLSPSTSKPLRVAVLGAGLSGLFCARTLQDHGHDVQVFEKSRGPGGRSSTRRVGELRFDHGAQYFTARDARFARWVDAWRQDRLVERWPAKPGVLEDGRWTGKESETERWVAVPGMSALCRHLAAELEVSYQARVSELQRSDDQWVLHGEDGKGLGAFDALVVSAPAPQTAALIQTVAPRLATRAANVQQAPCWAVMLAFAQPLDLGFDAAFVRGSALSWVARNSSKPGRSETETWVLHASPQWSREQLELAPEDAGPRLLSAFADAAGGLGHEPTELHAHRWRFAQPVNPVGQACLFDAELALATCGDWCGGPSMEGAFLSGSAAAGRLLGWRPDGARTR